MIDVVVSEQLTYSPFESLRNNLTPTIYQPSSMPGLLIRSPLLDLPSPSPTYSRHLVEVVLLFSLATLSVSEG